MAKERRRELRLGKTEDDLLVEASSLVGMSVSDFLLERAVSDAEKIVEAHRTISLQPDLHARFIAALDATTGVNPALLPQIAKARTLKSDS